MEIKAWLGVHNNRGVSGAYLLGLGVYNNRITRIRGT